MVSMNTAIPVPVTISPVLATFVPPSVVSGQNIQYSHRLAEVEANGLLWRKRRESRGVPQATRVTLLSFEPADARVVLALDELRNAGSFERLFRAQAGQIR